MGKVITGAMLKERIEIQSFVVTYPFGVNTKVWTSITGGQDVPAMVRVRTVGSVESIRAGRPEGTQMGSFTIRDDVAVLSEHRIVWNGWYWQVQGMPAPVDPRTRFWQFEAARSDAV